MPSDRQRRRTPHRRTGDAATNAAAAPPPPPPRLHRPIPTTPGRQWPSVSLIGLGLAHGQEGTLEGRPATDARVRRQRTPRVWRCGSRHPESPGVAPWSSSLVVCPHVADWQHGDQGFRRLMAGWPRREGWCLTLVPFHPEFLRWHGLPDGVGGGSGAQPLVLHRQQERGDAPATIVDSGDMNPFAIARCSSASTRRATTRAATRSSLSPSIGSTTRSGEPLPDNGCTGRRTRRST